jgi:hypothetical protein
MTFLYSTHVNILSLLANIYLYSQQALFLPTYPIYNVLACTLLLHLFTFLCDASSLCYRFHLSNSKVCLHRTSISRILQLQIMCPQFSIIYLLLFLTSAFPQLCLAKKKWLWLPLCLTCPQLLRPE